MCVVRPAFRIVIAAVRLSGIAVAGKAVRNPADETPQG